jgi:glutathione-regulated potassium-efflux system ancillary protein KefG
VNQILILFAHPAMQKSRINRILIAPMQEHTAVTFHDLYAAYPEFDIDVQHEQRLLTEHDIIIMHHPMFWYSTPAILKEWQDLVLQHGWAYGSSASALRGKRFLNVLTTGGGEQAYSKAGLVGNTVRELLVPIERTAILCGMHYLPPFVVHGTLNMSDVDATRHAEDYQRMILAMRDDEIEWSKIADCHRINENLDDVLTRNGGSQNA